jgi:hypothetical protein
MIAHVSEAVKSPFLMLADSVCVFVMRLQRLSPGFGSRMGMFGFGELQVESIPKLVMAMCWC